MPLILDTDHLTILQRRTRPAADRLLLRLQPYAHDDVATSIISFQEQIQGWMAFLNRARTAPQTVHAYAELELLWRSFCKMNVTSFDDRAQHWFARLRKQRVRLSTMDLRIASVALATDSLLLSRNLRDFQRVPQLKVEDWTQ